MPELTYAEKLTAYATAPKVTAGVIGQIEDGKFVNYWCGKLRSQFVQTGDTWKSPTKELAIESARQFRDECRAEAIAKGLLDPVTLQPLNPA